MFASLVAISFRVRAYLVERTALKDACGYEYVDGDFHWDAATTLKYPCVCFFAGVCAGLFGIGGGIVNGPLMLELGVLPPVAGATTACMILLTSTTAATTFLTFGLVQLDYAARLFWLGIFATCVGQLGMTHLIKKTGRSSYVAFSIGRAAERTSCSFVLVFAAYFKRAAFQRCKNQERRCSVRRRPAAGVVVSLSTVLMGFHGLVSLASDAEGEERSGGICGKGE